MHEAVERLRAAGIESARAEARILWEHAKGSPDVFASAVARRLVHEPVAYITGHKEFWSLDFEVGPGVLIPRPETETLVEAALPELPDRSGPYRVLDLGTGSACLLVAILSEYPHGTGVGIDSSADALRWASRNVEGHGLQRRIELVNGSWDAAAGRFDLILCNPPYIPTGDLAGLPRDVREFEPWSALDGGPDGLAAYRALTWFLPSRLAPGGTAVLEIGAGQHHVLGKIMESKGLRLVRIAPDLAGIPRCLVLKGPGAA